jgi:hypothetical protein
MALSCATCGAPFVDGDLDSLRAIARCRFCRSVTSIPPSRERPTAPLPARFRAVELPDSLSVEWRWLTSKTVMLAFFCVAWDSALLGFYPRALASGNLGAILFPIAHVAVGVWLTWQVLAQLFNRTRVEVEAGVLSVRHGPVPAFKRNFTLAGATLKQLYVKERVSGSGSDRSSAYDLCALTDDGRELIVLPGLDEPDQALYLEQQIERRLGIADREIAGELPRAT